MDIAITFAALAGAHVLRVISFGVFFSLHAMDDFGLGVGLEVPWDCDAVPTSLWGLDY